MNVLGQFLDAGEDRRRDEQEADDLWLRERAGIDPEERRTSWRRWLRKELEKSLQWPKNEATRERLIGQCAAELTIVARQLRGRGWLLDGAALAEHVRACLKPIATAQEKGSVGDFWPYFRASVRRYVGANAEEIQAHARRTGADDGTQTMAGALAGLGIGKAAQRAPSMTEILADHDAEVRRDQAEKKNAAKAQLPLL